FVGAGPSHLAVSDGEVIDDTLNAYRLTGPRITARHHASGSGVVDPGYYSEWCRMSAGLLTDVGRRGQDPAKGPLPGGRSALSAVERSRNDAPVWPPE